MWYLEIIYNAYGFRVLQHIPYSRLDQDITTPEFSIWNPSIETDRRSMASQYYSIIHSPVYMRIQMHLQPSLHNPMIQQKLNIATKALFAVRLSLFSLSVGQKLWC